MQNRFAAIADIHGNRWALEAVLADIARRGVRDIVNLGDHLWGPLDVAGTAELLIGLNLPSISGNQDREMAGASYQTWLSTLPFSLEWRPGVLLFHGTPSADNVYLLETLRPAGVTLAANDEIGARLAGAQG